MTHYVPLWAPMQGLLKSRAICGRFVLPSEDALTPTCPECVRLLAEDDGHRNAEQKVAALVAAKE